MIPFFKHTVIWPAAFVSFIADAGQVYVDPPFQNTIILENFNSLGDPAESLVNGVTFDKSSGGIARYAITGESSDAHLLFSGYSIPLDFQTYPHVRVRHAFDSSETAPSTVAALPMQPNSFFPNAISKTMMVSSYRIRQQNLTDGTGIRIDPARAHHREGIYSIDYIMLDRGRTIGFEFDAKNSSRGGVNNYIRGYNLGGPPLLEINRGISNGLLSGVPTSGDPWLIVELDKTAGLPEIDTSIYKYIEIRLRVVGQKSSNGAVYYENASGGYETNQLTFALIEDDVFHVYLLDMTNDANWNAGPLTDFRFDPTNQMQAFEVDYIRFYEKARIQK